jgi:hypothetical protein
LITIPLLRWPPGGTKGFRTFLVLYPDHDLGIVLLTNETDDNAGRKLYDITNLVLKAVKPLK